MHAGTVFVLFWNRKANGKMRKAWIIVALALTGCSQGPTKEQAAAGKAFAELKLLASKTPRIDSKAKLEALKKDRSSIVLKAIEKMQEAAAKSFGTAEAASATITAQESGIKDFGDEWEVTGMYVGPDDKGKRFKAPWTARMFVMLGQLQCRSVNLGKREPLP
jgi:hypothetical protein